MLGIVLIITVSTFIRKKKLLRSPSTEKATENLFSESEDVSAQDFAAGEQQDTIKEAEAVSVESIENTSESSNNNPLVAPPLTSPEVNASTVYSSTGEIIRAPDSVKRDAYGLHWNNRSFELDINGFVIRGAMVYWADGKPGIDEPSCIDITLPFEITYTDNTKSNVESYAMMTPSQRGGYLLWLAGGRNSIPSDLSWVYLWFVGLERRALLDKQDISLCVVESLRMLPFVRNDRLYKNLRHLAIWLTMKYMLPEEQILKLIMSMSDVPIDFFNIVLNNYCNAKLPLPSYLAYIIMCYSPLAKKPVPYTENLINAFAGIYKNQTGGGLILKSQRSKVSLTYISINASISENKRKQDIIDLPDFFVDITQFKPLINSWNDFIKQYESNLFEDEPTQPEIKQVDWEPFIHENLESEEAPLIVRLGELASFLEIDQTEKPSSAVRKGISKSARIEGYLIIPELCISGKQYSWEDIIALTQIDLGEKIGDEYSSAALIFEFVTALIGENAGEYGGIHEILYAVISYFTLKNDELTRLNILHDIFYRETQSPENLGECLQTWLKTEEREYFRDVIFELLNLLDEGEHTKQISEKLHKVFDIKTETYERITAPLQETGEKLVSILSTLFRNK
jgi:hypothetical protein